MTLPLWANIPNLEFNQVTTPKLAVNRQIEQRQVPYFVGQLQPGTNCPYLLRLEGRFGANDTVLVPGSTFSATAMACLIVKHGMFPPC